MVRRNVKTETDYELHT